MEDAILRPTDIDYARDLFTELVVTLFAKSSIPLGTAETEALAEKSLSMATLVGAAQQHNIQANRASLQCAAPPIAPLPQGSSAAFAHVAQQWMTRALKRSAGNSRDNLKSRFERFVLPHLGARHIGDIEPQEILSIVRSIESKGYLRMAYATFHDLRFLYRYALAAGLTNHDPTATLRRAISKPKAKGTNMIMDPESVGKLLRAIRGYEGKPRSTAKYMLQLMPMVFLRASELRTLQWVDVDLDAATIAIPAPRMKMGRPHVVPLARQAVKILRHVHQITGAGHYVFTAGRLDKPFDATMFYVMFSTLGYRKVVNPQGFRVLASTWLNELGWSAEAIERQLSHQGADRTRRLYNHAEYLAERRRMMQQWADHLESLERKSEMPLQTGREMKSGKRIKEVRHVSV